jgi:hypothetical protein
VALVANVARVADRVCRTDWRGGVGNLLHLLRPILAGQNGALAVEDNIRFLPIAAVGLSVITGPVEHASVNQLPAEILQRADIRSGELAWRPSDIPAVIEAARLANLVSLGGNLQVRVPSGWGESIYASVDITRVADNLSWEKRVEEAAKAALADFLTLQKACDFQTVARDSFPSLLAEV